MIIYSSSFPQAQAFGALPRQVRAECLPSRG